jgi:hypothetical protein
MTASLPNMCRVSKPDQPEPNGQAQGQPLQLVTDEHVPRFMIWPLTGTFGDFGDASRRSAPFEHSGRAQGRPLRPSPMEASQDLCSATLSPRAGHMLWFCAAQPGLVPPAFSVVLVSRFHTLRHVPGIAEPWPVVRRRAVSVWDAGPTISRCAWTSRRITHNAQRRQLFPESTRRTS